MSDATRPVIESPQVRPGKVRDTRPMIRVLAFFGNAALGNSAIQQLSALGVPQDRLGVTPPERIERGQGMVLSVACPDAKTVAAVEVICKRLGAEIREQRGTA